MGTILGAVTALATSAAAALLARSLPGWQQRVGRGGPLWLGLAVGLLALWLAGDVPQLVVILAGAALVAGLAETLLQLVSAHWMIRLAGQGTVVAATMGMEYLRGDLFALTAVVGVAGGVAVLNLVGFATRAAQLSGAGRTPALLALLCAAYLFAIAQGLPNPGLAMLVLVVAAAILPIAVLRAGQPDADRALGPTLAAVAWVTGFHAWLGNASPAMVLAPLAVVGLDVVWTLTRRLATKDGWARLAPSDGWWRAIDAWASPADDLVAQRVAVGSSVPVAAGWLIGFTAAGLTLSIACWLIGVPALIAAAGALLVAAVWLMLQLVLLRRVR